MLLSHRKNFCTLQAGLLTYTSNRARRLPKSSVAYGARAVSTVAGAVTDFDRVPFSPRIRINRCARIRDTCKIFSILEVFAELGNYRTVIIPVVTAAVTNYLFFNYTIFLRICKHRIGSLQLGKNPVRCRYLRTAKLGEYCEHRRQFGFHRRALCADRAVCF